MESVNSEGKKLATKRELWKMRCIPGLGAQHMSDKRNPELEARKISLELQRGWMQGCVVDSMLLWIVLF